MRLQKLSRNYSRGFTLMELMIVMVIMGILAAIVMGNFASSTKRGRDSRRKSDLKNITTALETYYNDKGEYPTGSAGVMVGCSTGDAQPCAWGGQMTDSQGTLYMVQIPQDPLGNQTYYYTSNGQKYMIYAKLENALDEGVGVDQGGYADQISGFTTNCSRTGSVPCTYGVASPDSTP